VGRHLGVACGGWSEECAALQSSAESEQVNAAGPERTTRVGCPLGKHRCQGPLMHDMLCDADAGCLCMGWAAAGGLAEAVGELVMVMQEL
jgi:hypothetical protein